MTVEESYQLADKYQTVRMPEKEIELLLQRVGRDRLREVMQSNMLENAERLTKDMISKGYDGLIVIHKNRLEIVDYRPYQI